MLLYTCSCQFCYLNVKQLENLIDVLSFVENVFFLLIVDPPEPPQISGYDEMSFLVAGQSARMTCTSVGGNPPATLSWYKGKSCLPLMASESAPLGKNESYLPLVI